LPAGNVSASCAQKNVAARKYWTKDTLETDAGESIPQEWEPGLLDWVAELPPASRAVIVLHYLQEMSFHEVATVLEILPGTVKSRLAYGLARCADIRPVRK